MPILVAQVEIKTSIVPPHAEFRNYSQPPPQGWKLFQIHATVPEIRRAPRAHARAPPLAQTRRSS